MPNRSAASRLYALRQAFLLLKAPMSRPQKSIPGYNLGAYKLIIISFFRQSSQGIRPSSRENWSSWKVTAPCKKQLNYSLISNMHLIFHLVASREGFLYEKLERETLNEDRNLYFPLMHVNTASFFNLHSISAITHNFIITWSSVGRIANRKHVCHPQVNQSSNTWKKTRTTEEPHSETTAFVSEEPDTRAPVNQFR
jgi:hypothetical protein